MAAPRTAGQAPGSCPGPAPVPLAPADVLWGWASPSHPGTVTWIRGTLADSYERACIGRGPWLLVSSHPISAFWRVMAAVAAEGGTTANEHHA